MLERASHRRAELMSCEWRRVADIEEVARVHPTVTEELEDGTMPLVGTRLRCQRDDAAHRAAVIGRVCVGDDAELAEGFDP